MNLRETINTYDKDVDRYIKRLEFSLPKRELDNFMEALNGTIVLDAGCGAGRDSAYLSENGMKVIGIDLSEGMLSVAQERAPKATFLNMDVRHTKFQDSYFDGIWCYNTLLHLDEENINIAIGEFEKILKNNGILFIATKLGKGSEIKQSSKGAKQFFSYEEDKLIEILRTHNFRVEFSRIYQQKGEDFIDIFAKKG